MSILIDENTTFIIQGITGREAVNMTRECLDYGSKVVGGVTPGRGGRDVYGVPVFDTVKEITSKQKVDGSVLTVPPAFVRDAAFEAIENGIKLLVIVTERVPRQEVAQIVELASLRILGRERPIPHEKWARELKPDDGEGDQPAEVFQDIVRLRRLGAIGFRYHEEKEHGNHGTAGIESGGRPDIDMAVEVLEKSAELLLPALESLTRYADWVGARPFRYITATDHLEEE